ncbi:MAG: Lcl domain-containing protein [Planctomycetota bacterium]
MKLELALATAVGLVMVAVTAPAPAGPSPTPTYPVVDTGQDRCYDAKREIRYPATGKAFFGQDAQYLGNAPSYEDHGDGTVTDRVTGLMWQQEPGAKKTFAEAVAGARRCRLAGYADWRLPTIKELYSLILFSGTDPAPRRARSSRETPFIDTRSFRFSYGDPERGERVIDAQFASSTRYRSTTMRGDKTVFGVNFADGRIKGYGLADPRSGGAKRFFVLYVRGNPKYGRNDFHDNSDGTVTDRGTGLTWMQVDSGHLEAGPKRDGRLNWRQALEWAEGLTWAGKSDWRLPNAKELQSIVDYSRCPDASRSAAIDAVFKVSTIVDESGKTDYPFYWTGTTHASLTRGSAAVYVAFGEAPGWMPDRREGGHRLLDVHGAGSQRSDPKDGDPAAYPRGRGPQGDVIRIYSFVRCVRGGVAVPRTVGPRPRETQHGPEPGPGDREGAPAARFIRRLDRDGDGKVSRSEFDGPARHSRDLDRNGDGFIDESEAPTGPPPDRGRRRGR